MDDETRSRLFGAAADSFGSATFLGILAVLLGWLFGAMLGAGLARSVSSPRLASACRRIGPFIGVLAALPLTYKLLFVA